MAGRIRLSQGRSKYGAKRTTVDGIAFDSKKEAGRYQELRLLEKAQKIRDLTRQIPFKIVVGGILICKYVADFQYFDMDKEEWVVEDAKGYRTREYKLKKKLLWATQGIDIVEV